MIQFSFVLAKWIMGRVQLIKSIQSLNSEGGKHEINRIFSWSNS